MGLLWTAAATAKCSPLDKDIDVIGPFFGAIGFIWGYLLARKRGGKSLDGLQHGAGFAIAFALVGGLLGIALGRFLGVQ